MSRDIAKILDRIEAASSDLFEDERIPDVREYDNNYLFHGSMVSRGSAAIQYATQIALRLGRVRELSMNLMAAAQDRPGMRTEELILAIATLSQPKLHRAIAETFPHLAASHVGMGEPNR